MKGGGDGVTGVVRKGKFLVDGDGAVQIVCS